MATAVLGKWGNSYALRIPQLYCNALGVAEGSKVDISLQDNKITICPSFDQYTLQERMKSWDGERYDSAEINWGGAQGDEIW